MANRGRPSLKNNVIENQSEENLNYENDIQNEFEQKEYVDDIEESINETNDLTGTNAGFNPFNENVVQRDYSTPPIANQITEEIEEPSFRPPNYDDIMADRSNNESFNNESQNTNPFDNPNPALNNLDSADQKIGCEMLVDTCLDAYEQLHSLAQWYVKVDEEELLEKQLEGKIHLQDQLIPISEDGTEVPLGEFINTFNEQCTEALAYDKSFSEKVRPAMIRVFMKNGWGLTDGQFLGVAFGKDIVTKTAIVYSLKKTLSSTMMMIEKQYEKQKEDELKKKISQVRQEKEQPKEPINYVTATNDYDLYDSDDVENDYDYDYDYEAELEELEEIKKPKAKPKKKIVKNKASKTFAIDYPQRPQDTLSQHPIEIQKIIKEK
jgi:hypothetical protein